MVIIEMMIVWGGWPVHVVESIHFHMHRFLTLLFLAPDWFSEFASRTWYFKSVCVFRKRKQVHQIQDI